MQLLEMPAFTMREASRYLQRRSKSLARGRSWKHETYSERLHQKIVRATEPGFLGYLRVRYIGSTIVTDAVGIHDKTIYAWAKEGRIQVTLDVTGHYRVPYGEVWRLIKERE